VFKITVEFAVGEEIALSGYCGDKRLWWVRKRLDREEPAIYTDLRLHDARPGDAQYFQEVMALLPSAIGVLAEFKEPLHFEGIRIISDPCAECIWAEWAPFGAFRAITVPRKE